MAKAALLTRYPLAKANGNEFHKKQTIHCRPIYGTDKSKKGKALAKFIGLAQVCSV